jgi:hypothetical protein
VFEEGIEHDRLDALLLYSTQALRRQVERFCGVGGKENLIIL